MRAILLLLCFMVPAPAGAEVPPPAEPARVVGSGAFLAVSVPNIDESTRWYSEKLGLKVVMRVPKTDSTRTAVNVLEGDGLIVELLQHEDAVPLSKVAPGKASFLVHGLFKAGVVVENFDKVVAMLRARRVEIAFGPFPASATQRANVCIRDNAGNLIQFFGK